MIKDLLHVIDQLAGSHEAERLTFVSSWEGGMSLPAALMRAKHP